MAQKTAIIIGAGPAGLTAAYELLKRTDIKPIVLEATQDIGGISQTIVYKGNRIDIGGHRFFSKSDVVMDWWQKIMPLAEPPDGPKLDPAKTDLLLLVRHRLSRIYFLRKFFKYPINLDMESCRNLGLVRLVKIGFSYIRALISPIKTEKSLEDFLINRFGRELYNTFFRDYTAKVWGAPCSQINPEWGGQRIKGLSISKAIGHALKKMLKRDQSISQKSTETSLIERFLYPKFGPGQMWEEVARLVREQGGEVRMRQKVTSLKLENNRVVSLVAQDAAGKQLITLTGDYVISTMPVRDLIAGINSPVPDDARAVAQGLIYRDFMTAGFLLNKLKIKNQTDIPTAHDLVPDNWIYIQESDVKIGRLQIFNNWSPYLVADPQKAWIGLEYFCNEGDELWRMPDGDFIQFAAGELEKIGIIDRADLLDSVVIRKPKTYPAYFGTYDQFDKIRLFTDRIENLFLIGRNGMHRYNNQDHSMLTAIAAVDNIIAGKTTKDNLWQVNAEDSYHESK
ncbi:MAG: NAD(P)/FAD-dependent oxidoreductase [Candidatus Omnitrophica bacterium]|nr:NAD(P)/FAD-dependent oxidoreductase [Candidatus Omnitrophota bacterium]